MRKLFRIIVWLLFIGAFSISNGQDITNPEIYPEKKYILNWLNKFSVFEKYGKISDAIWSYAELGLQEYRSSELLASTLENEGFTVERNLAGMPTCFVGSYGTGKPVIGILAEFDALPGISQKGMVPRHAPIIEGAPGHGCGHNTMGAAAVSAAVAVKKAMVKYDIKGTIKLFGSPAEEMVISRPYMIRAGLFEDVDAVIDNHFSSQFLTSYGTFGNALYSVIFTFKGEAAPGGSSWVGRSALDAVEIMNVATNYLREHLHYTYRMHYVITEGGEAPNVVPDKASVWYMLRNTDDRIEEMYQRVVNCAKGAALSTGTELSEVRVLSAIHQRQQNKAAAELFQKNIELVGMPEWTEEEQEYAKALQKELGKKEIGMPTAVRPLKKPNTTFVGGGSSDVGDVTLVAPTTIIRFPGQVPGAINHHWSTVSCAFGSIAWKGLNAGAKAMAASAIDLIIKPEELRKLQVEFEEYQKEHSYIPFLPEYTNPPLELNEELMNKWRIQMEKYYQYH